MADKCSKCGQENDRKPYRYCRNCHAAYCRGWRKSHPLNDEQKIRATARNYPKTYVKRGKMKKAPCMVCGASDVVAHHLDYAQPLNIRWLCKIDHQDLHNFIRGY